MIELGAVGVALLLGGLWAAGRQWLRPKRRQAATSPTTHFIHYFLSLPRRLFNQSTSINKVELICWFWLVGYGCLGGKEERVELINELVKLIKGWVGLVKLGDKLITHYRVIWIHSWIQWSEQLKNNHSIHSTQQKSKDICFLRWLRWISFLFMIE